jgi:hypothetical protein
MNECKHNYFCEEGNKAKSEKVKFKNTLDRLHFQHKILLHHQV